jgi:DNA-binding NtrC family response regulator
VSEILIIDDDVSLCRSLQIQLKRQGHGVRLAHSGREGAERADSGDLDLVLLDLGLPDEDGIDTLHRIVAERPELPVVVVTARQDMGATVTAMRDGAFDYVRKPFEMVDVLLVLEKIERLRRDSDHKPTTFASQPASPHEIVGSSKSMVQVVKQIGLLSRTQVTVLLQGESGTGKELVARALHDAGGSSKPFVAVNCSAVVPTLFESELFGHEKGAFTGADARRVGRLEQSGEGTLFLDEIADMPLDLQAKLLRVLQERTFERVGGHDPVPFRARVVAATNRDLGAMVEDGTFREDLFFRLAVSPLEVPPLRQRREDIPAIAMHLLKRRSSELHSDVSAIDEDAVRLLSQYEWPGNVRELENAVTRAIALARGTTLLAADFAFLGASGDAAADSAASIGPLWQAEKRAIERTLAHTGGNITRAAEILEISRTTLRKKISDYDVS